MWMAATPPTTDDLKMEAVFGTRLPAWGSTIGELERRFPSLGPHHPHRCATEIPAAGILEVRDPPLSIAEIPVWVVDFRFGPGGLEAVGFDLGLQGGTEKWRWLIRHVAHRLGPPAQKNAFGALWLLPEASVMVLGDAVWATLPGRRHVREFERMGELAKSLFPSWTDKTRGEAVEPPN